MIKTIQAQNKKFLKLYLRDKKDYWNTNLEGTL